MSDKNRETALVLAAKNGNTNAFEELYKLYFEKIYALAQMTVKNSADAEDILQTTFVKAWQNIDKLDNPAAFNTWLQRIAINECNSLLRRSKPNLSIEDESEDGEIMQIESDLLLPEQYAERDDLSSRLRKIINELSVVQKETILLYYFNEMSIEEIAEIMDCSEGTVKSRLFLARKAIRTEIEEQEKKTGEKFYGAAGVALIPFAGVFIRQIQKSGISAKTAAGIYSQINNALFSAPVGQTSAAHSVANTARTATGAAKHAAVAAKASFPLWGKLAAGVVAIGLVAGGGVFAWKTITNPKTDNIEATEAIAVVQKEASQEPQTVAPTEAPTVVDIDPAELSDSLYQFIYQFNFAYTGGEGESVRDYDCNNLDNIYDKLVGMIASHPSCLNLTIYPGESALEDWTVNSDPLKMYDDYGYVAFDEDTVLWAMHNILNIPEETCSDMLQATLSADKSQFAPQHGQYLYEYELDGKKYLYNRLSGIGDPGYQLTYKTVRYDGNKYYIVYDRTASYYSGGVLETNYVEVSEKVIDGKSYWTLYRSTNKIPELPAVTKSADENTDPPIEPATNSIETTDYKQLYIDYLNSMEKSYFSGELFYINDDDVPELIIHTDTGAHASVYQLCWIEDGTVQNEEIAAGVFTYREKTGELFSYIGGMMNSGWHFLMFDGDSCYVTKNGTMDVDDYSSGYTTYYKINDEEVSEEEYKSSSDDAFNWDRIKSENLVNQSSLIEYIRNY